jgi:hypothetical protein
MGVEIFFTQVFRDGFFHADMHPGNILVSTEGRYIALDFGIMGTLTDIDKNYLAQNFLAFFRRDYRRVAQAHIEAGWVPPGTRVDEFEAAIRSVCEPIFDRPLKEISLRQGAAAAVPDLAPFNVEVQPQLVLLQKTLLNIEGLGRELDPELDLWQTAKPYLERWMSEQLGLAGAGNNLKREAAKWARLLPTLPRLVHQALSATADAGAQPGTGNLAAEVRALRQHALAGPGSRGSSRWRSRSPDGRSDRAAHSRRIYTSQLDPDPGSAMLLWFVILYLMVSVGIGLYAATRVITPRISPSPAAACRCRWSPPRCSPPGSAPRRCSAFPPPSSRTASAAWWPTPSAPRCA